MTLRERRTSMGVPQLELIARAKVSTKTLVKAERGEQIPPDSMARIVAALDEIEAERAAALQDRLNEGA